MSGFEFVSGFGGAETIAIVEKADDAKTTEEHMAEYIESMKALEDAMEPYKEQKRELKANYVENGWLTKQDISLAVKARAEANLEVYLTGYAGVAEHPDVVKEVIELTKTIVEADEAIKFLESK